MIEVQEVLDELAREGLIIANKSNDSKIRYRINKLRKNQILAMLGEGKQD